MLIFICFFLVEILGKKWEVLSKKASYRPKRYPLSIIMNIVKKTRNAIPERHKILILMKV